MVIGALFLGAVIGGGAVGVVAIHQKGKRKSKKVILDEAVCDFQKKFRGRIHEKIQQKEKQECLTYVGGEIKVFSETEADFSIKCILYFQDAQKEWHQATLKESLNMSLLTDEAKKELQKEKEISYDIEINTPENSENTQKKVSVRQ